MGAPFTFITINGVEHKVIIDLGSSSEFNLPRGIQTSQATPSRSITLKIMRESVIPLVEFKL